MYVIVTVVVTVVIAIHLSIDAPQFENMLVSEVNQSKQNRDPFNMYTIISNIFI
jgi:hypothetical protein